MAIKELEDYGIHILETVILPTGNRKFTTVMHVVRVGFNLSHTSKLMLLQ